jgi:uncharacterized protein (TIGR02265 family)
MKTSSTIKGIFINSHIKAVQSQKGGEGLELLEKLFGKPLQYKNSDNVPIRDEVRLIECAVIVLNGDKFTKDELTLEAGRLHFRNFVTTPLAKILFPLFKNQFKLLMLNTNNIAGHVFNGVKFSAEDLGKNSIKVIMNNNDYPINHFKGLFEEWMKYSGLTGTVDTKETAPDQYEYSMQWQ